jgi:hypothetical protein
VQLVHDSTLLATGRTEPTRFREPAHEARATESHRADQHLDDVGGLVSDPMNCLPWPLDHFAAKAAQPTGGAESTLFH